VRSGQQDKCPAQQADAVESDVAWDVSIPESHNFKPKNLGLGTVQRDSRGNQVGVLDGERGGGGWSRRVSRAGKKLLDF